MLQRVLKIISIVQGKNEIDSTSEPACGHKSYGDFDMNLLTTSFEWQKSMSLQEISNARHLGKKETNSSNFNLNIFMKQVIDILFQTWCEAISIDKKKQDQKMISSTVLPTLNVIVDLLLASESDLDNKLLGYIMNSFPLELLPVLNSAPEKQESYSINGINLDICLLVLRQKDCEHIAQVLDYIKGK